MNGHYLLGVALLATMVGLKPAKAERISENSQKAKATMEACIDAGSAQVESGGVTSCIHGGHGIVCGGPKPEHKGTCDTFKTNPAHPKRRTGAELARLGKSAKPSR